MPFEVKAWTTFSHTIIGVERSAENGWKDKAWSEAEKNQQTQTDRPKASEAGKTNADSKNKREEN